MSMKWIAQLSLCWIAIFCTSRVFGFCGAPARRCARPSFFLFAAEDGSWSSEGTAKQKQEMLMEELSRIGADRIAALDIPERAKRALLAETLEDRIFDLTEELEQLVGDSATIDESVMDLARQIKALQVQYQELVSGKPSPLLQSLEAALRKED